MAVSQDHLATATIPTIKTLKAPGREDGVVEQFRLKSKSEIEKEHYFEKLLKGFLENHDLQGQCYDQVWHFGNWAKEQSTSEQGIDLDHVAV